MMRTVVLVAITNSEYADKLCDRLSLYSSNFYFHIVGDLSEENKILDHSSMIECDICLTDNFKIAKQYDKKAILFTDNPIINITCSNEYSDLVTVNFTDSVDELFFHINNIFPNIRVNLSNSIDENIYYIFSDIKCSGTSVIAIMIAKTLLLSYGYNTLIVKASDTLIEKNYYSSQLDNEKSRLWNKMDYYIGQNKEVNPIAFVYKDLSGLDWIMVSKKNLKKVIENVSGRGYERIVIDGGNELCFSSGKNIKIHNYNDIRSHLSIKSMEADCINVINRLPISVDISRKMCNSDENYKIFYINEDKSAFQIERDYIKISPGETFALQIDKMIKEIETSGENYGL